MEETITESAAKRCAVVTGGNKGIGIEICRQLASNGVAVILTARDEKKGSEAVDKLKVSGLSDVVFHPLDVTDPASIASLAEYVQNQFGKLDILVNNAGVSGLTIDHEAIRAFRQEGGIHVQLCDENAHLIDKFMKQTYEEAEECIRTNYFGTKGVTEALLPLLQLSNSARIVNISSVYGQLKFIYNGKVKEELQNVDSLTKGKIDEIVQWFLIDFKENRVRDNGWPILVSAYKVSKAAINAYTRLTARKFPQFRVNCVHPGNVKTDINGNTGLLTPEEGAKGAVMLALLPDDAPSGSYFDGMLLSSF